ncbi:hypothetical protein [Streptomyces sp. NPDC005799]|uniref:hypothetical protein n=1 Tax=Streptomyces sp. NPDC005799 TaxID=3154678 RepID=UPI0033E16BD3
MSTTAPAPKDDRPAEQPFNPHTFPADLVEGQRELAETYAALHALQKRLPWGPVSRIPVGRTRPSGAESALDGPRRLTGRTNRPQSTTGCSTTSGGPRPP